MSSLIVRSFIGCGLLDEKYILSRRTARRRFAFPPRHHDRPEDTRGHGTPSKVPPSTQQYALARSPTAQSSIHIGALISNQAGIACGVLRLANENPHARKGRSHVRRKRQESRRNCGRGKKDRHRPRRGSRLAVHIRRRRMRAITHHPRARH